jgi:hypothetical protein
LRPPDLCWPAERDLEIAPELAALGVLDAALAVAGVTLLVANPELSNRHGTEPPDPLPSPARAAAVLLAHLHHLRAALRRYRDATLDPVEPDDPPPPASLHRFS